MAGWMDREIIEIEWQNIVMKWNYVARATYGSLDENANEKIIQRLLFLRNFRPQKKSKNNGEKRRKKKNDRTLCAVYGNRGQQLASYVIHRMILNTLNSL